MIYTFIIEKEDFPKFQLDVPEWIREGDMPDFTVDERPIRIIEVVADVWCDTADEVHKDFKAYYEFADVEGGGDGDHRMENVVNFPVDIRLVA